MFSDWLSEGPKITFEWPYLLLGSAASSASFDEGCKLQGYFLPLLVTCLEHSTCHACDNQKFSLNKLARIELKFYKDLEVSYLMQLFTTKTTINLDENTCGGRTFPESFTNFFRAVFLMTTMLLPVCCFEKSCSVLKRNFDGILFEKSLSYYEKRPYSKFFWSECGKIRTRKTLYALHPFSSVVKSSWRVL